MQFVNWPLKRHDTEYRDFCRQQLQQFMTNISIYEHPKLVQITLTTTMSTEIQAVHLTLYSSPIGSTTSMQQPQVLQPSLQTAESFIDTYYTIPTDIVNRYISVKNHTLNKTVNDFHTI